MAEDVPCAALWVVVVEDRQHALAFGGVRDDAAVDAFDDRLRVFVDHQAPIDRVVFAHDFQLLVVPALDDTPDLLEETQVSPLRFVAMDAAQVVAGQRVDRVAAGGGVLGRRRAGGLGRACRRAGLCLWGRGCARSGTLARLRHHASIGTQSPFVKLKPAESPPPPPPHPVWHPKPVLQTQLR